MTCRGGLMICFQMIKEIVPLFITTGRRNQYVLQMEHTYLVMQFVQKLTWVSLLPYFLSVILLPITSTFSDYIENWLKKSVSRSAYLLKVYAFIIVIWTFN